MNARDLVRREPALAILMGAMAGPNPNMGFGFEQDYGYGFGLQPGMQNPRGFGFGVAPPAPPGHANPHAILSPGTAGHWGPISNVLAGHVAAAHVAAPAAPGGAAAAYHASVANAMRNPASTEARTQLLDPNRDSTVKVERYSMAFSPVSNLVLGTASAIPNFSKNPQTSVKIDRVITNAPNPGFVFLSFLQIANVSVFVGGQEDAFTYSALAQNVLTETPRLDPQNSATVAGNYSGMLPVGFAGGFAFPFTVTLQGASTMAGGWGQ